MPMPATYKPLTLILTAGLVASCLALAGCDKGDETARAKIVSARATLAAMGASGAAGPTAGRAKAYQQVISDMQSLSGATGATQGAAKLITAQATLGQAEIAAKAQRDAENEAAHLTSRARAMLELYVKQSSLAASMEGHDLTASRKSAGDNATALDSDLKKAAAALEELRSAETLLRSRVDALGKQAQEARARAGERKAGADALDAQARLAAVEDAAKLQREADSYEVQQGEVELEASGLRRRAEALALDVQRLERQKELAQESAKRVEDSGALLVEQARAARTQAGETGAALAKAVDELAAFVEQSVRPTYAEATGKYNNASSAASGGRDADAGLSKALSGAAQQALAILHAGHAATLEGVATLAAGIGAQPSLPNAAKMAQAATALRDEAKAAKEAAASAAAQAGANFQSANTKGASGEVFKRIGDRLAPPEQPAPVQDAANPDAPAETPAESAPTEPAPEGQPVEKPADAPSEAPASETPASGEPAGSPKPK